MRYEVIDGCPCPKPLFPLLKKLKAETGCTYNSIYRGEDVAGILHRFGKHTQAELFAELPAGMANPPDRGTHILLGDGVVGRLHEKLPWWKCGIDVNDEQVEEVIAAAKRHGWTLYRPYPSGSEFHHLNFAHKPKRWRAFFRAVFGGKKKPQPHHGAKHPGVAEPTKMSAAGLKFIGGFEGFRADAYWDALGQVWTIAFGHTGGVKSGQHVTRAQGLRLLSKDTKTAVTAVLDLVTVHLSQKQLDALGSFTFNLGAGALAESTLLKKLNQGNYRGAAEEFKKWDHAGGVEVAGLKTRRNAEARLFEGGPYA
jgi:lysozyme